LLDPAYTSKSWVSVPPSASEVAAVKVGVVLFVMRPGSLQAVSHGRTDRPASCPGIES
jgi:hypothetical protein